MSTVEEWVDAALANDPNDEYTSEECLRAKEIVRIATFLAQIRRGEPACICGWCATALTQEDIDHAITLFMNIDIATRDSMFVRHWSEFEQLS